MGESAEQGREVSSTAVKPVLLLAHLTGNRIFLITTTIN